MDTWNAVFLKCAIARFGTCTAAPRGLLPPPTSISIGREKRRKETQKCKTVIGYEHSLHGYHGCRKKSASTFAEAVLTKMYGVAIRSMRDRGSVFLWHVRFNRHGLYVAFGIDRGTERDTVKMLQQVFEF